MTIADLNTFARYLVDADTTSYTAANLLIALNQAYEEVVGFILGCDGLWQFDDTNYTDFPIGTTALVASQQDYTFDITHLEIEAVSVKDSSGIFQPLTQIDISQMTVDPSQYSNVAGMPSEYDKQGKSLLLYPAPSAGAVTLASGLKVFFKRTASVFTSAEVTTGTKQPGFASPYHHILAYKAALPYAMSYKKDRVAGFINEINKLEKGIAKHYGQREQDRRKIMSPAGISYQ